MKDLQPISLLAELGGMIERLRGIAAWLQAERRPLAGSELQLLAAQLNELIATLGEGPSVASPDGGELIAELRLVQGEIEALSEACSR